MDKATATRNHSLERTSPLGGTFIGTCMTCGRTGLLAVAATEPCDATVGMTDDEADALLVKAVRKGDHGKGSH